MTLKILGIMDKHKRKGPESLPVELLKSLCFNCDNRFECKWKEQRKIYCEHFE